MTSTTDRSLRRNQLVGLLVVLSLVGGLGAWAGNSEIAGAVIVPATVIVESKAQRVQHLEGGIIDELRVRDGDRVKAGALLARLDDTETRANLGIVRAQIDELSAEKARLEAEQAEAPEIAFPETLLVRSGEPAIARILEAQRQLLHARRQALEGQKQQLREQIAQLEEQITGLSAQQNARDEQIRVATDELATLRGLDDKGLVQRNRLTALERELAQLNGDRGQLIAERAGLKGQVGEIRLRIIQLGEEQRSEVLGRLNEVRTRLATLLEESVAAEARLARIDIRAPRAGFVHQLAVHTVGGVAAPGEALMLIVPEDDELVLQGQMRPDDVDQVHPGQDAVVRFPAFDQRTTPEVNGEVFHVGADLTIDQQNQLAYIDVLIRIPDEERARLADKELRPGLPAEAFIQTESRTVLSYLLKPLTDQIKHAFRE